MHSPLQKISNEEQRIAKELSAKKSQQYKHARGNVRFALSQLLNIDPLEIPLEASVGKAPLLRKNLGHISFSHCNDALILGWSSEQIGVDIERSDRRFAAKGIANRFFNKEERNHLQNLNENILREKVLEKWIIKEAAIKWQKGTIARDLKEWIVDEESEYAIHKRLNYQVKVYKISYQSWKIAIASNQILNQQPLIICST